MSRKTSIYLLVFTLVALLSFNGEVSAEKFSDIPEKYEKEILYLIDSEIITGYPNGEFRPYETVTRAQAATMVGRSLNLNGELRETSFVDVKPTLYAAGFIESGYENDIINGYGDGTYKPFKNINRLEMAYLLSKALSLEEVQDVDYIDLPDKEAHIDVIKKVTTARITNGYSDKTYKPNKSITRVEFALMLARAIEPSFKIGNDEEDKKQEETEEANDSEGPTNEDKDQEQIEDDSQKPVDEEDASTEDDIEGTDDINSQVKIVTASVLNVRKGPGLDFERVGQLIEGTHITVYEQIEDWFYMSYGDIKGYVHIDYLTDKPERKIIVIDAGHGGKDPGASGNGLIEKDINLDVAKRLKKLLENAGVTAVMTREDDTFLELSNRVELAIEHKADIFISIHTNSFYSSIVNGTETYYSSNALHSRGKESKNLAENIHREVVRSLRTVDRGVKDERYIVLQQNRVPAVLVELGFITNTFDAFKLGSNEYHQKAAEAIFRGLNL